MGGSSHEREFSLESGQNITNALKERGHEVLHLDTESSLVETLRTQNIDAVYIALHGKGGEDGTIQALLEYLDIPYVGSTSAVCRIAWNKSSLPHALSTYRRLLDARADVNTNAPDGPASWPKAISLASISFKDMGAATALDLVAQRLPDGYPLAVKPARGGSAMGVTKVEKFDDLGPAIIDALSYDTAVIIEQWIKGVELAVGVVGTGPGARVLPPVEIVPKQGFFDIEARQDTDLVDYYCPVRPASLNADPAKAAQARELIEQAALEVHRALDCRDISRVDLIWDGTKPQILDVSVSPGMTEHSLIPMACATAHTPFGVFIEQLLRDAMDSHARYQA
jgi:D-alanine-D-alanine ligase